MTKYRIERHLETEIEADNSEDAEAQARDLHASDFDVFSTIIVQVGE